MIKFCFMCILYIWLFYVISGTIWLTLLMLSVLISIRHVFLAKDDRRKLAQNQKSGLWESREDAIRWNTTKIQLKLKMAKWWFYQIGKNNMKFFFASIYFIQLRKCSSNNVIRCAKAILLAKRASCHARLLKIKKEEEIEIQKWTGTNKVQRKNVKLLVFLDLQNFTLTVFSPFRHIFVGHDLQQLFWLSISLNFWRWKCGANMCGIWLWGRRIGKSQCSTPTSVVM